MSTAPTSHCLRVLATILSLVAGCHQVQNLGTHSSRDGGAPILDATLDSHQLDSELPPDSAPDSPSDTMVDAPFDGVNDVVYPCSETRGDCDGRSNNGCEAELLHDPSHCGKCGGDCLGGRCEGGQCQAVPLVSSPQGKGRRIAVDDSHVYVTIDKAVFRLGKDGSGRVELASNEDEPSDLVLTDSSVLFKTRTEIRRVDKNGGGVTTRLQATQDLWHFCANSVTGYAVQGDSSVLAFGLLGGQPALIRENDVFDTRGCSATAEHLFLAMDLDILRYHANKWTEETSRNSGPIFATPDNTATWFYEGVFNALYRKPLGTKESQVWTTSFSGVNSIIVDQHEVFLTTRATGATANGKILRAGLPKSPPMVFVADQAPVWLAQDDTALYWVNDNTSVPDLPLVMKIAKGR